MVATFLEDIKHYSRQTFLADSIAGLTVAIILIPQGMAYALLAGMPPIYGLYAGVVPMIIYPLFGSSTQLSVGPVALMSIIVFSGVSLLAEPGSSKYIQLVILVTLLAGMIQMIFSFFRLGIISNFLSRPVMSGFISAAGVIIGISQIKYLLSLNLPRKVSLIDTCQSLFSSLDQMNLISLLMGMAGLGIIMALKKIHRAIPGALLIVMLGCLITFIFRLDQAGIPIVGHMPSGLPGFTIDFLNPSAVQSLFPTAVVVALICFIGSFSIAKTMAIKTNDNRLNANRELMGLGVAKVVGSFFLSMPSTGSFTRSAINEEAGGKTGVSSILGGVFVGLIILFFSHLFYYLPEPVLAAIVISTVFGLIDYNYAKFLLKVDRSDFWVLVITFISTLLLGIVNGVFVGIIISLITVLVGASRTHVAELGVLEGTDQFRNITRYKNTKPIPKTLILRFSQPLFFANAETFYQNIIDTAEKYDDTENIIISYPSYNVPDGTSASKLLDLVAYCKSRGWRLIFTDLNGPIRDFLHKSEIFSEIGEDNFYLTIGDAVKAIEQGHENILLSNKYSKQTNYQKNKNKK
jgi:SulP family sulfate permease